MNIHALTHYTTRTEVPAALLIPHYSSRTLFVPTLFADSWMGTTTGSAKPVPAQGGTVFAGWLDFFGEA